MEENKVDTYHLNITTNEKSYQGHPGWTTLFGQCWHLLCLGFRWLALRIRQGHSNVHNNYYHQLLDTHCHCFPCCRVRGHARRGFFNPLPRFRSHCWPRTTMLGKNEEERMFAKERGREEREENLIKKQWQLKHPIWEIKSSHKFNWWCARQLFWTEKVLTLLGTRITPAPCMHDIIMDLRWESLKNSKWVLLPPKLQRRGLV